MFASLPLLLASKNYTLRVAFNLALKISKDAYTYRTKYRTLQAKALVNYNRVLYQFYQAKHQSETITFLLMAGHDNTSLQKTSVVLHTTDFSK